MKYVLKYYNYIFLYYTTKDKEKYHHVRVKFKEAVHVYWDELFGQNKQIEKLFDKQKEELENEIEQLISLEENKPPTTILHAIIEDLLKVESRIISSNSIKTIFSIKKNQGINSYRIIGFSIKRFHEIETIYQIIDNFPSFIVFTGENSRGKTLLLKAIGGALDRGIDVLSYKDYLLDFNLDTIINVFIVKPTKSLLELVEKSIVTHLPEDFTNHKIVSVAYGASRLLIQTAESMDAQKRQGNIDSLFRSDIPLLNIEYWLKMRLLGEEKDKVENVLNLLCKLMPHVTKVGYRKDKKEGLVFEYEESGKMVRLEQLSAGQKSIIAFVGDMIIRLWEQQPEVETIADLEGIVLIDEIEAHLHPKWQREFPKLLHEIFPKVQFIVTTHSPIPLLGMPEDTALFHVTKDAEKGIQAERLYLDIKNMSPQQILTSPLFGIESLRSLYNENLKDFNTEENYQEMLKNKEVQDRIKTLAEKFTFKEPEK